MFGKKSSEPQGADITLFTIYDSKSRVYDIPTMSLNKDVLCRDILNMFRDPKEANSKLLLNAEDYSIFKLGTYSKTSGEITLCTPMEHVVNIHDLRALAQPGALAST